VAWTQREVDRGGDAVAIAKHVMVPEPDEAITLGLDGSRPVCIPPRPVLAAIHFDNKPCAVTAEIDGVGQQRHLPPEVRFRKALAEDSPHPPLCIGCVASEAPRAPG
jgi:hypothetical protein